MKAILLVHYKGDQKNPILFQFTQIRHIKKWGFSKLRPVFGHLPKVDLLGGGYLQSETNTNTNTNKKDSNTNQVAAAHSLRDFHPSEYLGMLGLFGAIITSIQV